MNYRLWLHGAASRILLLAIAVLTFFVGPAAAFEAEDMLRRNTSIDGNGTPYRVLLPDSQQRAKPLPLIVFLNGSGQIGSDNEAQVTQNTGSLFANFLSPEHLARQPIFLVAPQSRTDRWNPDEIIEVVAKVRAEFDIDADRIYLTGLSTGGSAVWDTLKAYPDIFAAGVPISSGSAFEGLDRIVHIPLWIFHGINDHATDRRYGDGGGRFGPRWLVTALLDLGGHPGYTEYDDDGHNIWDRVYADERLFPWLIAQHRPHITPAQSVKTLQ
ncbi:prolyl oligopeptidase family serine peptidase [Pseudolysobacter antarcticus]|uniref:carboxylesterase family protein n=1 Tax=Pseudolysobacter antarcticus TaxID=2511995 RepID=UPI0013EBEB20|nr:PHB depolymerase family esterase [Pseudolysobacter antarcticus]